MSATQLELSLVSGPKDPEKLSLTQKVAYVLERFPQTRDSDPALWMRIYIRFYGLDPRARIMDLPDFLEMVDVPTPDTITRRRREIQHIRDVGGALLPSPDIAEHRLTRGWDPRRFR